MKIAVVGAGYAGLAVCWHLLQRPKTEVVLYDARGVGGGASGVSTGLLHPYIGKRGRPAHRFEEAMAETKALLEISERELGRPVALRTGIFRFAMTEEQRTEFSQRSGYCDEEETKKRLPEAASLPGLWIPNGVTVFSQLYLQGLFQAAQKRGMRFLQEEIVHLNHDYDRMILATGYEVMKFPECKDLPLKARKGQALICRFSGSLPCSIIGVGHLSLMEDPAFCQLGSTYEDAFDERLALGLREKVAVFYPPARDLEVVEIVSGTRIAQRNETLPLVRQLNERVWVFTGLGSRGLLYHSLFAKELVEKL